MQGAKREFLKSELNRGGSCEKMAYKCSENSVTVTDCSVLGGAYFHVYILPKIYKCPRSHTGCACNCKKRDLYTYFYFKTKPLYGNFI